MINTPTTINGTALVTSKDGKALTTSLKVAEVFDRKHHSVLEAVRDLECSEEFINQNFLVSSYQPQGAKRSYPMIEMTRDGFSMLVNLTNLHKAAGGTNGTRPSHWLELDSTQKFISAVEENVGKSDIIKTTKGRYGGTFAHGQIALAYAKYLPRCTARPWSSSPSMTLSGESCIRSTQMAFKEWILEESVRLQPEV